MIILFCSEGVNYNYVSSLHQSSGKHGNCNMISLSMIDNTLSNCLCRCVAVRVECCWLERGTL